MITYEVNVVCEGKNCPEVFSVAPADQADAHAALVQALHHGWAIKGGKHLCPKCAIKP